MVLNFARREKYKIVENSCSRLYELILLYKYIEFRAYIQMNVHMYKTKLKLCHKHSYEIHSSVGFFNNRLCTKIKFLQECKKKKRYFLLQFCLLFV